MKLRTGEPWMSARDYGRSLKALTINLLLRNIDKALQFQPEVLGAEVVYSDPDFRRRARMRGGVDASRRPLVPRPCDGNCVEGRRSTWGRV